MGGEAAPSAQRAVDSWVMCDRCSKWRRIPGSVADALQEDTPWYCEMNTGSIYNDCDVPQELTDQQIDQIHEDEEGAGGGGGGGGKAGGGGGGLKLSKRPPVWQIIKQNIYTHRARKEQDEDDIMICQCPRLWGPPDPKVTGCGPNCLNRMLNIECVTEFCPCGERCSNQMFTRREYAALDVRRAGAKGFGLFTTKALKAGDFIIEYIGEVLEEEEYLRRKEFYIMTGQRHYYFMNVGNGEVIDACRKGHVGRFINHSCDPNCETQKWLVHGELAIGLFALRDVEAGEELTFDYNFERYGDKPMKCLCGSKNCRGIIGGTQEGPRDASEAVVPAGAENEPEPIMVTEEEEDRTLAAILDREVGLGWEKGWNATMERRLAALATAHGLDLAALDREENEGEEPVGEAEAGSEGRGAEEEEAAGSGDEEISDVSSEGAKRSRLALSEGQEGSEAGEVSAGGAPATSSAQQQAQRRGGAASPSARHPKAPQRQKQQQQPGAAGEQRHRLQRGSGPSEDGEVAWAEAEAAAELAAKLHVAGSKKQRILSANQAAKAAALASQQLPLRKRLKKLARAMASADQQQQQANGSSAAAGGAGPATSTASQRSGGGAGQRPGGKPSAAGSQSVASTSTVLAAAGGGATAATTTPLIPRRTSAQHPAAAPSADRGGKARRRSEIDRRLDDLVGPSGKLRDLSPAAIIRFLRLFNLCDIGPTISKAEEEALRRESPPRHQQRAQQQQQQQRPASPTPHPQLAAAVAAEGRSPSRGADSAHPTTSQQAQAQHGQQQQQAQQAQQEVRSPGAQREEGEVSPAQSAEEGAAALHGEPQVQRPEPPRQQQQLQQQQEPSSSPTRQRDRGYREDEGVSRLRAAREEMRQRGELSPRQRARLADMSLLLDVVLKTNRQEARHEFVKCGILRQLLATVGHNVGPQYAVILKKVIRVVESLPFTADDMHHTRSAHGSFADLLRELTQCVDYEVKTKSYQLLRQYPVKDCTRPVQPSGGGMHSSAVGSSRSSRWALAQQWREGDGPMRSPSYRGEGGTPMSPHYHGRERDRSPPHREPSRLGGMHRGGRSSSHADLQQYYRPGSGLLRDQGPDGGDRDRDRHPYAPLQHGRHAHPYDGPPLPHHPHPMQQPGGPVPRGFPGAPPPPGGHRHPGGGEPGDAGSAHPSWWGGSLHGDAQQQGYSYPPSRPGPPPGEPPPPAPPAGAPGLSPLELAKLAAASIASKLMGSQAAAAGAVPGAAATTPGAATPGAAAGAGTGAGASAAASTPAAAAGVEEAGELQAPEPEGGTPLSTVVPTKRRKRSRWESEGATPAAAAATASDGPGGSLSLLPPGFGGAAQRPNSPPPRPPSILATAQRVSEGRQEEGGEPPAKRAAAAAAAGEEGEVRPSSAAPAAAPADSGDVSGGSSGSQRGGREAAAGQTTPMERLASLLHEAPSLDVETQFAEGGYRLGIEGVAAADAAGGAATASPSGAVVVMGNGSDQPYSPVTELSPIREPLDEVALAAGGPGGAQPHPLRGPAAGASSQRPPLPPAAAGQYTQQPQQQPFIRVPSGAYSDVSRGDSGSSGPPPRGQQLPPRPPQPPPAASLPAGLAPAATSNGSMHVSPLTNPSPSSQSLPGANGAGPGGEVAHQATAESHLTLDVTYFSRATVSIQDESWGEPNSRFERFVGEMVRVRIGKYMQPGHPAQLDVHEGLQLYKKVKGQVVSKEHEAYAERKRSRLHKPIVRSKLEARIREFVRDSVRRILTQRGGGGH